MKGKIIIGNWKMNPRSLREAEKLYSDVAKSLPHLKFTRVVICPPYPYLEKLKKYSRRIVLGAQDSFWDEGGAYTGEVSSEMLYSLGVQYVILGHSERRALGENDVSINKKIKSALSAGLTPVVCVGEKERDTNHEYFSTVKAQVEMCLKGISKNLISKIIIAYEPVWALSTTTGRHDATPADAREMATYIRRVLTDLFGVEVARAERIIYGGSVNRKDVGGFISEGGVDGVLPGRASLDPEEFIEIVKICEALGK